MRISKFAIGAIAMLFIGTLYNAIAFILPMWTVNKTVNAALTSQVTSTNFRAGLWGFCVDSQLANSSAVLDHCYFFRIKTTYDLSAIDDTLWPEYATYGVCDGYSTAGDVSDATRLEYATTLATAAGLNGDQFDKFLDKSCGTLGFATMSFGGMSMSNGVMAFVALLLAFTCCKGKPKFVLGAKFLACVAAVTALLTFVLWIPQSKPLGKEDDASLKTSFFIMLIAAVHYPIALVLLAKHFKQTDEKAMDDDDSAYILEAPVDHIGTRV